MSTDSDLPRPEHHSYRHQAQFVGWTVILLVVVLVALVRLSAGGRGRMEVHGQTVGDVLRIVAAFIPALVVYLAFRVYRRDQWWKRAEWALEAASEADAKLAALCDGHAGACNAAVPAIRLTC